MTAAALAVVAGAVATSAPPSGHDWTEFALLVPLAALAPLFTVSIARNHGFHTGAAFVVAGVLVLPPVLVVALVLLLPLPGWVRERKPWYVQTFNTANYVLSALAAVLAVEAVGTAGDIEFAIAGLAAASVFVAVNHFLLAMMLRLGRGRSFRETGLFAPEGLGIELVLALLGVAVGALADTNPWLLPALIGPLVLGHLSLSTLALLRESEARFRAMFESAPSATMLFDRDGTIVAANRSAEAMLGYDEGTFRGTSPAVWRHPDDHEEGNRLFGELVRGERDTFRRETRYLRRDGATVVAQLAAALVRDAEGKPDYVIAMAEDVTEQRQLEEQLRQSQKLEAIGRLAGGVAHDFNNMLTAIGGYTTFALEHAEAGSALRSDLDEIRKATDRATLLTRQLLAFSRKQVLKPEVLNLNAVVLELESMLRPLIGEQVKVVMNLDPALKPIEADPSQFEQVVMNLVVNARDAMPAGGTITITTSNATVDPAENGELAPGRYVALAVGDEGEGMDEATLRQIFEPFFTTKAAGQGTGLGLATVYGIVKQSGGYIEVESEVGVGSVFTIYLQRASGPRRDTEPTETTVAAVPKSTKTVLVVDDEEVVRRLIRDVLVGRGYDVLVAEGGEEALALAADHGFQLLLTDLTMPGLGGREVVERLRPSRPELKVVYMSGYAEEGLTGGDLPPATAFLAKPFSLSELLAVVSGLIGAGPSN